MNLTLPIIGGKVLKVWVLPEPLNLSAGSPDMGHPNLVSVQPGSYSGTTPGYFNFPVPNYNTMTATVRAGGGGGAMGFRQASIGAGGNGGASSFASSTPVAASPGLGHPATFTGPPPDQGGSGGTVTVGGGGAAGQGADSDPGYVVPNATYNGSAGGRVTKTWNRTDTDSPVPGTTIGITVGNGGAPGTNGGFTAYPGGTGSVNINWS